MKLAIVTRADAGVKEITDMTLPIMREYAAFCNADLKILSGPPPVWTDDQKPHYRILKNYQLLDIYDRILCLDADMLINKNCPNIFDIVPEDKIGSIYEDVGSRAQDRRFKIKSLQQQWGDVGWKSGYTNAGTFLFSKQHKNIFLPHNGKFFLGWGSADLHLSYNIHKYGFDVHELHYRWNHMTMFSEQWNDNADRFQSNIIHYAGRGVFDSGIKNKVEQIKNDCRVIYGSGEQVK